MMMVVVVGALLNGATVALVITGVLGPFHDKIAHRHFLLVALTVEVLGLFVLLYRNRRAIQYEQASAANWYAESGNPEEAEPTSCHTTTARGNQPVVNSAGNAPVAGECVADILVKVLAAQ